MKKILFIILCILFINCISCKKNNNTYKDLDVKSGLTRIYYYDKDGNIVTINDGEKINKDLIIDNKIRIDVYFTYLVSSNSSETLPNLYYKGSKLIYELVVNDELIGQVGKVTDSKTKVEFQKTNEENEYLISETDNIYLNLAVTGNYSINYYYNYYIDEKIITSTKTISFIVE